MAVPVAPFDRVDDCDAKTCGSELSRSSVLTVPESLISCSETVVTGAIDVRLGEAMREPVTMIGVALSVASVVSACGAASCA